MRERSAPHTADDAAGPISATANGRIRGPVNGARSNGAWAEAADEIRAAVIRHLRASFQGSLNEHDFEDVAQETLIEIHCRVVAGDEVRDPRAFAKRVAWRKARDMVQGRRAAPSDPQDRVLTELSDGGGDPEARLLARAELARAIEAAERLTVAQQVVYRSRFVEQQTPRETCRTLKLNRQTYYSRLKAAVAAVEEALEPDRFSVIERELLSGYLAGTSSPLERRRARRLLAADPHAVAMFRELRDLHQGAAVVLPVPVVDRAADLSLAERMLGGLDSLRDRLAGAGSDPLPEQAVAQLSGSGAGRAAGTAGGGVLAKLGLAGGTGKLVASCVAGGAVATVCVATGVAPFVGGSADRDDVAADRSVEPAKARPVVVPDRLAAEAEPAAASSTRPRHRNKTTEEEAPKEPASVSPAVDPATPPVEQEFGVAAAAPAPNPANQPGGAASQKDVQQEFGP